MSSTNDKTKDALDVIIALRNPAVLIAEINQKTNQDISYEQLPVELKVSEEGIQSRHNFLHRKTGKNLPGLLGKIQFSTLEQLNGNIENYIGMSMVPTGVIGPLRVIGSAADGDYYVPLATSEGALVASYHRGAKACFLAGGATSICLVEGVQRSPLFKFKDIAELGQFLIWLLPQLEEFKKIVGSTSRFASLTDMQSNIEGNQLILTFEYHTGDASGQNMVTMCTDAICQYIIENSPVQPVFWFIESNYSGDKKATSRSFSTVRGKKVTAEITLSEKIVNEVLKTTPSAMSAYWISSTLGIIQSGAIGAQGHYANGLAALFLATGQDVACISEASIGITRMEVTATGDLYASVTLPNLIVGTVGGGTGLPTQKECLELMDCYGVGNARKYAEICGALILAGELSIAAALSAGHFTSAHKKFGRKK
ncbi:MAG: hydroxymethylglutaryl-CoA reductase [Bacteroidetes bacterium]|nr:hydroxymethylglutaryl-CoA reductase [Bacteroidota bacterium]